MRFPTYAKQAAWRLPFQSSRVTSSILSPGNSLYGVWCMFSRCPYGFLLGSLNSPTQNMPVGGLTDWSQSNFSIGCEFVWDWMCIPAIWSGFCTWINIFMSPEDESVFTMSRCQCTKCPVRVLSRVCVRDHGHTSQNVVHIWLSYDYKFRLEMKEKGVKSIALPHLHL